jgi:16S rRNA (guanine527-N7)-methyltransferase
MLSRHGIELSFEQVDSLDTYREVLWRWNEKLNLTRHTDYEKFVGRDVVDSLAFEPFLEPAARVMDVGCGGGVPGMILAIVRPDLQLTLTESVAKRARAAEDIARQAGLDVRVVHTRAQDLLVDELFDVLIARAVAPLPKLLTWLAPHWDRFGQLLVIKGPAWIEERARAREAGLLRGLNLRCLATYTSPTTGAESVVLRIRP